jgi:hypothetical protein
LETAHKNPIKPIKTHLTNFGYFWKREEKVMELFVVRLKIRLIIPIDQKCSLNAFITINNITMVIFKKQFFKFLDRVNFYCSETFVF